MPTHCSLQYMLFTSLAFMECSEIPWREGWAKCRGKKVLSWGGGKKFSVAKWVGVKKVEPN